MTSERNIILGLRERERKWRNEKDRDNIVEQKVVASKPRPKINLKVSSRRL